MAEHSKIEWTDSTFNPWIGCAKVSPGCKHCYAETFASRFNKGTWGVNGERSRTSPANWNQPRKWDRKARQSGKRRRVFCGSLCDVFEENPQVTLWRAELIELIAQTRGLDWLLLTKRPENVMAQIAETTGHPAKQFFADNPHVWIGASMENQEQADKRAPVLLGIPASVRFASIEPLLGPIDITPYVTAQFSACDPRSESWRNGIEWIIVGGESGQGARPMHPQWARDLRDACRGRGAAFFFKQWGEWMPYHLRWRGETVHVALNDLRILGERAHMVRVGKQTAGRELDGETWSQTPPSEWVNGFARRVAQTPIDPETLDQLAAAMCRAMDAGAEM